MPTSGHSQWADPESTQNKKKCFPMRFLTIVKSAEKYGFPPQGLLDAIEKLRLEAVGAGSPELCS